MILKLYRKYIANQVAEKMEYVGCCPNERDIILRTIDPTWHKGMSVSHCDKDCLSTTCLLSKSFNKEYLRTKEMQYRGNDL